MKKFESGFASHQSHESGDNHEVKQVKPNAASMTAMCGVAKAWNQRRSAMLSPNDADDDHLKQYEDQTASANQFLTQEYAYERSEILKNPEYVGANLNNIIVNGQIALADKYRQTRNIDDLPQRYRSFSVERVDKFISDQDSLMGKFDEYVQSFNGQLKHARIHQTAHLSPLGMGNAVRSDGSVVIAPEFVRQVNILQQAGVSDLMVTAELYNDRDGNQIDGYLTGQQRQDYINMISQLIALVGDNLVIELGNETNTNIRNDDGYSMSAVYIEPDKYAEFYRDVASQLKQRYPNLRLAPAGTAFADYQYLKSVLDGIGDDSLVDVISCHPYRGAVDGVSRKPEESDKTVPYFVEEQWLVDLASQHGAEYQIGEIAYGGRDQQVANENLDRDLRRSADLGIVANIWPRTGLPF